VAEVEECLLCKCEALGSNHSTTHTKKSKGLLKKLKRKKYKEVKMVNYLIFFSSFFGNLSVLLCDFSMTQTFSFT
jgi:hypothetical protein